MSTLPQPGELVFVYGSLKKGGEYQWVMQKAGGCFVGQARLDTPYPLVLERYPCLLDQPGIGFRVKGELYRIERSTGWIYLDRLEGHPEEYVRRPEQTTLDGDGGQRQAWVYFYQWPELLDCEPVAVEEFKVGG